MQSRAAKKVPSTGKTNALFSRIQRARYGDNSFLPDRIEAVERIEPVHGFVKVEPDDDGGITANIARLTVTIDRADMSRTRSMLFRPVSVAAVEVPDNAWVNVRYD